MEVIRAEEVSRLIKDGDTIMYTGITLGGFAEEALVELEKSFLETGHPRDLTMYWQSATGNRGDRGLAHAAHEGFLKRGVGGHLNGCGPAMTEFSRDNKGEIYNFPQGVMSVMCRHIAAHTPGVITKIGLKSMMDPRVDGGCMNEKAKNAEPLVELIELQGEEWLWYKLPKLDVTLIRGTVADTKGNISCYKEGYKLGQLSAAEAARACGGIVICQVENIVEAGSIKPRDVVVPGILIDYVFVSKPEYHWQTSKTYYNPVFSGEIRVPLDAIPFEKLSARKVIARRAAMELTKGAIVNLGVGIPEAVSSVAAEEGCGDYITLTTEAGGIGGVPASSHDFGCCWNAEATIEMADEFDMYDGGALDLGVLGVLQVGPNGNVNVSKRNGEGLGVGGFLNVAGGASKVVFAATFTGGLHKGEGPAYEIGNGHIKVTKEGNSRKFVNEIEQISFNGEASLKQGKKIIYVTERCVFELVKDGLLLTEIAPGVDLQKDILDQMDFAPMISEDLEQMPAQIFNETWGGLKDLMDKE